MKIENLVVDLVTSSDGKLTGHATGGHHNCHQVEGCRGLQIAVRWSDKSLTWPCTAGMTETEPGRWRIGRCKDWKK